MVVFGLNKVWSRIGFGLNFKFKQAHWSASLLSLPGAHAVVALLTTVLLPPPINAIESLHPHPHACAIEC
jgi:hypothetical protein